MATGGEIQRYIMDTADKFGLRKYIQFNTTLQSAVFNEAEGVWDLIYEHDGKTTKTGCEILVGAAGTQNTPKQPTIPGLSSFGGPVMHTGHWDSSVDLKNKRIAVIGNGSSGIQVFGALQAKAAQITHYIRAPTWISLNYLSQFTPNGKNFQYSAEDKAGFQDPANLLAYRKKLEATNNGIFKNLVFDETCQDVKMKFRETTERVMKERLGDDAVLHKRLIPSYQPWCRRLTPGDGYLEALQSANAELVDVGIKGVTGTGIRTMDGKEREFDVLVAATGYVNSRVVPWEMVGRKGVKLADRFKEDQDGYLSVCAPDMPNYFSLGCGPNFTIANGSVLSAFGFVADYILAWVKKIATEDIRLVLLFCALYCRLIDPHSRSSITVKDDAVEAYNIYIQEILRRTAWNKECNSWYKKGRTDDYRTGITAIYPGSMNHFKDMLSTIRGEHFDIEYRSKNPFAFFGNGLTERDMVDGADLAYYLDQTCRVDSIM